MGLAPAVLGVEPGKCFIDMDYLTGSTLGTIVESTGSIPVWHQHRLLEIANALDGASIEHGDLSLSNLMEETPGGRLMVIDFGSAKANRRARDERPNFTSLLKLITLTNRVPRVIANALIAEGYRVSRKRKTRR